MTVVAVYHIKGGVGKTATAVNLAWSAAQTGARTLLWDLDPQGSASFYFRVKPHLKGGLKTLLKGKSKLRQNIKGSDYEGLDLLPADFELRNLDLAFQDMKQSRKRLRQALDPLLDDYDIIFLDCPPNLTLVTENIIRAADVILCPVIPTTLSQRTLETLSQFLQEEKSHTLLLPFFSMVEKRKSLHKDVMASLPGSYTPFLTAAIPYLSEVERMGLHREPVGASHPSSIAARAYTALYEELCTHMQQSS